MFILAAPLAYLVVSLMAVGIGHDLSSTQDASTQPVLSASQSGILTPDAAGSAQ